jgi:hypothetical protein
VDDDFMICPISNALRHHANIEIQRNSTNGHVHLVQTNFLMPSTMLLNLAQPLTMAQHIAPHHGY